MARKMLDAEKIVSFYGGLLTYLYFDPTVRGSGETLPDKTFLSAKNFIVQRSQYGLGLSYIGRTIRNRLACGIENGSGG